MSRSTTGRARYLMTATWAHGRRPAQWSSSDLRQVRRRARNMADAGATVTIEDCLAAERRLVDTLTPTLRTRTVEAPVEPVVEAPPPPREPPTPLDEAAVERNLRMLDALMRTPPGQRPRRARHTAGARA